MNIIKKMFSKLAKSFIIVGLSFLFCYFFITFMLRANMNRAISKQCKQIQNEARALRNVLQIGNIQSIISTTFGAASVQLDDVLNAYPAGYHHFSPLLNFGFGKATDPDQVEEGLEYLTDLFACDYRQHESLLQAGKMDHEFVHYYGRQAQLCVEYPMFCWNTQFLARNCELSRVQSMTVMRLHLKDVADLLADKSLNVRILLLVRDPRAIIQSRRQNLFCDRYSDCANPQPVCSDMEEDYAVAQKLLAKHPTRFRTLRYEDIWYSPHDETLEVLKFFGLPYNPLVEEFLANRGVVIDDDISPNDPISGPFRWRLVLTVAEIKKIQSHCTIAMKLWGYRKIDNFTDFRHTFDPIQKPPPLRKTPVS